MGQRGAVRVLFIDEIGEDAATSGIVQGERGRRGEHPWTAVARPETWMECGARCLRVNCNTRAERYRCNSSAKALAVSLDCTGFLRMRPTPAAWARSLIIGPT